MDEAPDPASNSTSPDASPSLASCNLTATRRQGEQVVEREHALPVVNRHATVATGIAGRTGSPFSSPKRPSSGGSSSSDDDNGLGRIAHRAKRSVKHEASTIMVPRAAAQVLSNGTLSGLDEPPKQLSIETWMRTCGTLLDMAQPPFPIVLVGQTQSLARPFAAVLNNLFIRRDRGSEAAHADTRGSARFHKKTAPSISIADYIARICNYLAHLEPLILLTVLSYALRLDPIPKDAFEMKECVYKFPHEMRPLMYRPLQSVPVSGAGMIISLHSVHRFVIAAVCLASKAMDDNFFRNEYYAQVGGVPISELNALELDLASLLDWHLQCTDPRELWQVLSFFESPE